MSSTHRLPRPPAVALGFLLLAACEGNGADSAAPRGDAPVQSESPSAKIYPAPLQAGVPRDLDGPNVSAELGGTGGTSGKKVLRWAPRTLSLLGAVEPELVADGETPGFQLDLQVPWPEAPASVHIHGEQVRLSPLMSFYFLPESARHAARLRIELTAGTFPLPAGTEFLASADTQGWLVIWPDRRSYRVVDGTSIRSVLEERRVDRVPLVAVEVADVGAGRLLGRDTRRFQFQSTVGTLLLETVEVPEVGGAGALACAFLLALLRADPQAHCADGAVPVYARFEWSKEQALEIAALRLVPRADFRTVDFALPPRLGIFKPGELPPPGGPSPLDPERVWPDGQASASWQVLSHHDVPMYFFVDGFPVALLDPHVERVVRVPSGEHRHAARDWLGQVLEAGGVASAAAPLTTAPPTRPEGPARPTVQYGAAPEPELD